MLEPPADLSETPHPRFATGSDGTRIQYIAYPGSSPTFLIANTPGAPALEFRTSTQMYGGKVNAFRRDRSAVIFDWRGTGESDPINGDLTIDDLVADLDAVTEAIEGPVDARAWAMAGYPVCLHAAERPERYRSLQLDGVALRPDESRQGFHFRPGWEANYLEFLQGIARNYWALTAGEAQRMALRVAQGVGAEAFGAYNGALAEVDLTGVLPRIKTPTWVTARTLIDYAPSAAVAALLPTSILTQYQPEENALATGSAGRDEWDKHLGELLGEPTSAPRDGEKSGRTITARERDVLAEVATGATNKQIAAALGLSHWTIQRHVSNLLRKTGLKNRRQLMRFADDLED